MNAKQKARAEIERRTLEGIAEYQQLMAEELCARFAARGFTLEQTGGGCTAYVRDVGGANDNIKEYVTVELGNAAPTHNAQRCRVSLVCDGETAWDNAGLACETILRCLEDPSDEYTLLNQRLDNGVGSLAQRS